MNLYKIAQECGDIEISSESEVSGTVGIHKLDTGFIQLEIHTEGNIFYGYIKQGKNLIDLIPQTEFTDLDIAIIELIKKHN